MSEPRASSTRLTALLLLLLPLDQTAVEREVLVVEAGR